MYLDNVRYDDTYDVLIALLGASCETLQGMYCSISGCSTPPWSVGDVLRDKLILVNYLAGRAYPIV
jgi:hypothetical protein